MKKLKNLLLRKIEENIDSSLTNAAFFLTGYTYEETEDLLLREIEENVDSH